jgi:F420-dependent methylenetetrahydromethanopterin dehydrogenase
MEAPPIYGSLGPFRKHRAGGAPNRALQHDRGYNTTVQDAKLIVVESCGSRPEAELVRGALEESGIPAIIQGDTAGGMREHLAWSGAGFKILVREENAIAARDFLAALAKGEADPDASSETDPDSLPPGRRST